MCHGSGWAQALRLLVRSSVFDVSDAAFEDFRLFEFFQVGFIDALCPAEVGDLT